MSDAIAVINHLDPCPFCKCKCVHIETIFGTGRDKFAVVCLVCDARGPRGLTSNGAIAMWQEDSRHLPLAATDTCPTQEAA